MSDERRQHSIGVVGRIRRRVLPPLSRVAAVIGLLVLIAWIVGRVYTDEYRWSQYLWWVPPIWAIGTGWILAVVSLALAKMSRRPAALLVGPLLWLLTIGSTLYVIAIEWNMHRMFGGRPVSKDAIRVLHWNRSDTPVDLDAWGQEVREAGTDIVLIANSPWGRQRQRMLEQFADYAPDDRERWINYRYRLHADPAHFRVENAAVVASRFPMLRTGMVHFGRPERREVLNQISSSDGWVMFIEFDLQPEEANDEPFVVWFVDLPSDPFHWKQEQMKEAMQAIYAWNGTGWEMGRHVWEQTQRSGASFPEPDLVIGDFNTPRGSASLSELAPGFADAHEQAGHGPARSWRPRFSNPFVRQIFRFAHWHIDLALVAPEWRAVAYELVEPDRGPHSMQVLDLVPADRDAAVTDRAP